MKTSLLSLLSKFEKHNLEDARVIPWASPVPVFGKVSGAKVGTLGLNPSNREFVNIGGEELTGLERRFHTLRSLELKSWEAVEDAHLEKMVDACEQYFHTNPYNGWFQELDVIINSLGASYYGNAQIDACHLDLIPFATSCKWTELTEKQRQLLLVISSDAFTQLLKDSEVSLLILNGMSVVRHLESISNATFKVQEMPKWALTRNALPCVKGLSFKGKISCVGDHDLGREVTVLGYNHNIQSSFGVTKVVKSAIRSWIENTGMEAIA